MTENMAARGEGLAGLGEARAALEFVDRLYSTKGGVINPEHYGLIANSNECGQMINAVRDAVKRLAALEAAAPAGTGREEELRQVLESVQRQIGWHGNGPLSHDEYYCEHCKAPPAEDCANINHFHDCLVLFVRRALATPSPQAPQDLRASLESGLALVESAFAHVSHGGPTRADAEKWIEEARNVLSRP